MQRILNIAGPVLILIAIALSVYIRFDNYKTPPPLFIDEANVGRNLAERSIPEFWEKLDYEQYAPPVLLTIWKTSCVLFGYQEYALRALSLICSLLCMLLLYRLGNRYIDLKFIIAFPIIVFGMTYEVIFQSYTIKQYMPDLTIAMAFMLFAIKSDYKRFFNWKELVLWTVLGTIAVWASMPVVYGLASVGLYFAVQAYRGGEFFKWLGRFSIAGAFWVVNFGIYFVTILKADAAESYLQNYHAAYFLRWDIWTIEGRAQDWNIVKDIMQSYLTKYKWAMGLFFGLYVVGLIRLITIPKLGEKSRRTELILLVMPFLLACLSSFLGYYSMIPRLMLFTMPVQILIAAIGVDYIANQKLWVLRPLGIAGAICLIYGLNGWIFLQKGYKIILEDTRSSVAYVSQHRKSGEALLVNNLGAPVVAFYANYHTNKEKYGNCKDFVWGAWNEQMPQLVAKAFDENPNDTIWIILGHDPDEVALPQIAQIAADTSILILDKQEAWRSRALKLTKNKIEQDTLKN